MNFNQYSLTGPVCPIIIGAGPGVVDAATYAAATVLTPAQVAAANAL